MTHDRPGRRRSRRLWGPDAARDVADELSFHLEMKRQELLAAGVAPERVAEETARAFGDRDRIEHELREIGRRRHRRAYRTRVLDDALTDLRLALRSFARRPAVPAVIVATLALGIGAGTAVFSLFDAVVLNPLAVHRPAQLVRLSEEQAGQRSPPGFSYPMSKFLRTHNTSTAGIAGWTTTEVGVSASVGGGAEFTEQLSAGLVTGNYFSVLGLRPQHGRVLVPDDEAVPGTTPYVVLSDALWRRAFGATADVVGSTIAVNEKQFTVIGVAAPRFRGSSLTAPVDLWLPITMVSDVARSGLLANPQVMDSWFFSVFEHVARVPDGVPVGRVLAELSTLHAAGLTVADPPVEASDPVVTVAAVPLAEAAVARSRDELLKFLAVLGAVVAIVLAVACVNVANLLLMRARERRREMSVRAAIGASAGRVARQLLVESAALAAAAGVIGVLVAVTALRLVTSFSLPGNIALANVTLPMDLRVLGFTAAVSAVCALAFGLAPAFTAARADVMDTLRGGDGHGRSPAFGSALVAVQVALSLVLLVGGSLLGRSLQQALAVETGFRTEGVATISVGLRQFGYSPAQAEAFVRDVIESTVATADVTHAAAATRVPVETGAFTWPIKLVDDALVDDAGDGRLIIGDAPRVAVTGVTPGFLETLGLDLVAGRAIDWSDRQDAAQVALVSENAAQLLWPGENPIGREFIIMFGDPFTVVGVIRDAHFTGLADREPHILVPLLQTLHMAGMDRLRLVAAGPDAAGSLSSLREVVRVIDSRLPTFDERNVKQRIDAVLMPQRFGSLLLAALAMIALLTCAIGIYAVATYDVATRRRELGIRAALGAHGRDLARAILQRTGIAICAGAIAGLMLASVAARGLRSLLFGITPYEPIAYVIAALALALVAALASLLPARRAARTDVLDVMRET